MEAPLEQARLWRYGRRFWVFAIDEGACWRNDLQWSMLIPSSRAVFLLGIMDAPIVTVVGVDWRRAPVGRR